MCHNSTCGSKIKIIVKRYQFRTLLRSMKWFEALLTITVAFRLNGSLLGLHLTSSTCQYRLKLSTSLRLFFVYEDYTGFVYKYNSRIEPLSSEKKRISERTSQVVTGLKVTALTLRPSSRVRI